MVGNIMPAGFRIYPSSVNRQICNGIAAYSLDVLPHCPQRGSSYCRDCLADGEPSLRCAGDPDHCSLKLPAPDLPTAA
jgi:hypothetical protein